MPREHTLTRMVQFAETDTAGVMHFSNYFRLMEEAEHAWWRSIGLSVHDVALGPPGQNFSWPRVAVSCEYAAPARFEDVLELSYRVTRVGRSSLEQEIEFRRDGQRIALGRMKTVCCALTPSGFRPIPIPEPVLEKIKA